MSPLLWATIVIAICTATAVLVIAIVGTIENASRRKAVALIIMWTLINSGIICSTLLRIHYARHVPNTPPPVETERMSEARYRGL